MAIKIKIIKEERNALLEFAPEEVGDGDGYLSWDTIADMYIHNSKNMSEKQWLQPDNSEWYSGHYFEQKYQIGRDRACFAALGPGHNYLFKDRLRNHMISKGVLPKDAPKPPVSFFEKILKHFDKKFGLVDNAAGFHNCGNYYGVETSAEDTTKRDKERAAQTRARHNVVTGKVDKMVADLDLKEIKMSKKYSSNEKIQLLAENFKNFVQQEGRWVSQASGESEGYGPGTIPKRRLPPHDVPEHEIEDLEADYWEDEEEEDPFGDLGVEEESEWLKDILGDEEGTLEEMIDKMVQKFQNPINNKK